MKVNWNALDPTVVKRALQRHSLDETTINISDTFSDRIFIFHQGLKLASSKGRFIGAKVDLLVEYLIELTRIMTLLKKIRVVPSDSSCAAVLEEANGAKIEYVLTHVVCHDIPRVSRVVFPVSICQPGHSAVPFPPLLVVMTATSCAAAP
jgi:hypothetical protein